MNNDRSMRKEFKYFDIYYTINLTQKENLLDIRLSEYLDLNVWELSTNLLEEKEEFSILTYMSYNDLIDVIFCCIESNKYKIEFKNEKLVLGFWVETSIGKKNIIQNFSFILNSKTQNIDENVKNLATQLKRNDQILESFKETIQIKLNDIKKEFLEHNKYSENELQKLDIKIKEIEDKTDLFCENHKKLSIYEKFGEKFFPKFVNPSNSNYNISNNGRTVEIITGGNSYFGIRSEELSISRDRLSFSIRIDNCSSTCEILVGYCLNHHISSSGFWNGNCLGMVYLKDGSVYYPVERANSFRGSKDMIITSIIDFNYQMIYFLLNGVFQINFKLFNTNNIDRSKICACIDLYSLGDKVSIIN